jgi:hypothetical protein
LLKKRRPLTFKKQFKHPKCPTTCNNSSKFLSFSGYAWEKLGKNKPPTFAKNTRKRITPRMGILQKR